MLSLLKNRIAPTFFHFLVYGLFTLLSAACGSGGSPGATSNDGAGGTAGPSTNGTIQLLLSDSVGEGQVIL